MVTKEAPVYGEQQLAYNVDGIEHLKGGSGVVTERLLTDDDLKRIRLGKLRKDVK